MLIGQTGAALQARHPAFAYQVEALEAVKALPFAALFHEQGLGKTKIGLDLALEWIRCGEVDTVLIVTKLGLIENWIGEIRSHTHLVPKVLGQDRSANFQVFNSAARFILTHYETIKSEERRFALFCRTRRVAAVLDESHRIKNPDAAISKALFRLADGFSRRVIMSGTPVANRPFDLWSQIFFLDGGLSLGTDFEDFRKRLDLRNDLWSDEGKRREFEAELGAVYSRISHFTVRETKASAGIELPDKHIENVPVEAEPAQRALYDSFRTELKAEVVRNGQLVLDDAEEVLKRLLRLVQVASNPGLIDQGYSGTPCKLPRLLELVGEAVRDGGKIIVWTNFVDNAAWLAGRLAEYGVALVTGAVPSSARAAAVAAFKQDAGCRVLVATPGAAKEGLTLTVANQAVFFDRSFSLDDYLQAQDRIHRISQTRVCRVWNLICTDTVDEWVDTLLAAKRLAAQLVQADISGEEYSKLASYEFGRAIRSVLGLEDAAE